MSKPADKEKQVKADEVVGEAVKEVREIREIRATSLGRTLALTKVSVTAGAKLAAHSLGALFMDKREARRSREKLIEQQIDLIVEELGRLKGSLMKAGQFISMYGDYFFPPKLNKILKHLQADSPPVTWAEMEKHVRAELGDARMAKLEIDPKPYAAASLGQVHLAKIKGDPRQYCLKIQYPNIAKAIDSDLRNLKTLIAILGKGEHGDRYEEMMTEFREILVRELDYKLEREAMENFRARLKDDLRFVIPEAPPEFCTGRILMTTFEAGCSPADASVLALPQSRRNAIGGALLELYFIEIFGLAFVQTDPHFGNYKIRIGETQDSDRLVLLDFGSMRRFDQKFVSHYASYVRGAYDKDKERIVQAAIDMRLVLPSDSEAVKDELYDLACIFLEPLRQSDKHASDRVAIEELEHMPHLIAAKTRRLIEKIGMRPPPREILLLDRKLLGIFVFLATLRALVPGREIVERHVPKERGG